ILGSASEGRQEIFKNYFGDFKTIISNINEEKTLKQLKSYKDDPLMVAMFLSYKKSNSILESLKEENDFLLFTFDTVVTYEGEIKHKPKDKEEARSWLYSYRGDFQEIITGYTIFSSSSKRFITNYDRCIVYFKKVDDQIIEEYINNNPVEKWAGGIAIERSNDFLKIIQGTVESIIGVPMEKILEDIKLIS
ncbi:MAG: Maf family protein, partial [Brevinematia bacterium]